jgi:hypothetical protein
LEELCHALGFANDPQHMPIARRCIRVNRNETVLMPPNERAPRSMPALIDASNRAGRRRRVERVIGMVQSRVIPIALAMAAIIVAACKSGGGSGY